MKYNKQLKATIFHTVITKNHGPGVVIDVDTEVGLLCVELESGLGHVWLMVEESKELTKDFIQRTDQTKNRA